MPGFGDRARWTAFSLWHGFRAARGWDRSLAAYRRSQVRNLQRIVTHAYETVSHYSDAMRAAGLRPEDIRSVDDLALLPQIGPADLAAAPERLRSSAVADDEIVTLSSSGTSGRAKTLTVDIRALFLQRAHARRREPLMASLIGRRFGHRYMSVARPGGIPAGIRAALEPYRWSPRSVAGERTMVQLGDPPERIAARINHERPDVLTGYGSFIGSLFHWADRNGVEMVAPKVVVYIGDRMAPADRRLIEERFGVTVLSAYASLETQHMGGQCLHRRFHIDIDRVAFRVVDDDGRRVPAGGTGHIVVSNLANRATVLLNYRLGDLVTVGPSTCPCGCPLPSIESIDGRSGDIIVRPGGTFVHGAVALEALQALPAVVRVRVEQLEVERFRLEVVPSSGVEADSLAGDLRSALRGAVGGEPEVDVRLVDAVSTTASGKVRPIVSHCSL